MRGCVAANVLVLLFAAYVAAQIVSCPQCESQNLDNIIDCKTLHVDDQSTCLTASEDAYYNCIQMQCAVQVYDPEWDPRHRGPWMPWRPWPHTHPYPRPFPYREDHGPQAPHHAD